MTSVKTGLTYALEHTTTARKLAESYAPYEVIQAEVEQAVHELNLVLATIREMIEEPRLKNQPLSPSSPPPIGGP